MIDFEIIRQMKSTKYYLLGKPLIMLRLCYCPTRVLILV